MKRSTVIQLLSVGARQHIRHDIFYHFDKACEVLIIRILLKKIYRNIPALQHPSPYIFIYSLHTIN